jgi:xanthine dehydrogenase small subunit
MRTAISALTLLEPRSLREALAMLHDKGPLTPLAGATDLYVSLNFGTLPQRSLLNLWGLDELRQIELREEALVIGALITYTQLLRSDVVRERLPMLCEAARQVGGHQIQNRGTIGGNIANGSPAGDTLPVLAAAEATVVLQSVAGSRRVAFTKFYTGYRQSVMRQDELIVAVEVPPVLGRQWFRKVGTRAAQAISKIVFAGVWGPPSVQDAGGRAGSDGPRAQRGPKARAVQAAQPAHPARAARAAQAGHGAAPEEKSVRQPVVRIALGSVAPTVVRAPKTEALLAAGGPIEAAQRVLQNEIAPIDDVRSSAAYRRRVTANLLAQFWEETA